MVTSYLDAVTTLDTHTQAFTRQGQRHQQARRRRHPGVGRGVQPAARQAAGGDEQRRPHRDVDGRKSLLDAAPPGRGPRPVQAGRPASARTSCWASCRCGDRLRDYFDKYQSSQTPHQRDHHRLYHGQDELQQDNAAIEQEKVNLWAIMGRLRQYVYLAQQLDAALTARRSPPIEATDPDRAKVLKEDMLFSVRQKIQDLLTQLAVSVQGYLALDLIRRNNLELIKGVDRATTTTVSALRTAVIVAQALADQKLVLDQITALNTTTVEPDRVDLARCSTSSRARSTSRPRRRRSTSRSCRRPSTTSTRRWTRSTRFKVEGARQHAEDGRRAVDRDHQVADVPRSRPRQTETPAPADAGGATDVAMTGARPPRRLVAGLARGRSSAAARRRAAARRAPTRRTANTLTVWPARRSRTSSRSSPTSRRRPASRLVLTYTGTLEGAEAIAGGDATDAAWFSQRQLPVAAARAPGNRIVAQQKIMLSPVIIGREADRRRPLRLDEQPERDLEGHRGQVGRRLVPLRDDQPGGVEQRVDRADRRRLGAVGQLATRSTPGTIDTDGAEGPSSRARR